MKYDLDAEPQDVVIDKFGEQSDLVLSSKIGLFFFHPSILLSHAKMIRDTVVGQTLAPKPHTPRLKNVGDAKRFLQSKECTGSWALHDWNFTPIVQKKAA